MRAILLSLLFASVLAAAPVPREEPPAFGVSGILTAKELETVPFKSRVLRTAEERKKLELKPGRRPEDYDVAVFLPRTRVREGEPIPAYFIVKNNTKKPLGLKMLIDFSGSGPHLRGECDFSLRTLTATKPVEMLVMHSTHCSEDSLVDIPANGYYVSRGNLNLLGEKPLPAGEHEVEWSCQLRASAPVKFTVLPAEPPAHRPKNRDARQRFIAVVPDDPEYGNDERFVWKHFSLEMIDADRMSAALAVGPFGKYVPDLRTIPAADDRLEVRTSLRRDDKVEKLIVTLNSKDPRTPVEFNDMPHVYLQIEEKKPGGDTTRSHRSARDRMRRADPLYRTPLTIEVPFDAEQWKELDFTAGSRVAVIVTSGRLEFPTRGRHIQEAKKAELERRVPGQEAKVWNGLVRSEFMPLNAK